MSMQIPGFTLAVSPNLSREWGEMERERERERESERERDKVWIQRGHLVVVANH